MSIKPQSAADTSSPVYICHGAEAQQCHVLSITPEPDSLWMINQIACHQIVGDTSSSISIEPAFGEFQDLPATGAAFKLHCPAIGEDRDMEMWLRSGYTAKPHIINLKLGHFRCVIASSRSPIRAPIIGQELLASVTIQSFYTQALVKGIAIEWVVDGVSTTVTTNESGVSEFQYVVTKEGKQTITAHLYNPYNDETETVEFPFTGFERSPWQQAKLRVNGNEVEFGKTAALIRAKANVITAEVTEDIARTLTLAVVESAELTLTASPEFDAPVQVTDGKVSWQVTSAGNVSGLVTLAIYSADVDLPWELIFAVMSDDLADEVAEILVDGIASPPEGIWFFRNEPQAVTLKYKDGSPVQKLPLLLEAKVLTGIQPGNLSVTPATETVEHSWSVRSHTNSGTFQLELRGLQGVAAIKLPISKVISHYLDEEVSGALLNGEPFPENSLFFRGFSKSVRLEYKKDSPLAGYPLELKAIPVKNLQPSDLEVSSGTIDPHVWSVKASNKSGTFRLEVAGPKITRDIVLPVSTVLSGNMADEIELRLNGVLVPDNPSVTAREKFKLSLVPRGDLVDFPVRLEFFNGDGIGPGQFSVSPSFDQYTRSYEWDVTANVDVEAKFIFWFHAEVGGFISSLKFSGRVLPEDPELKEPDIYFSGKSISDGDSVYAVKGGSHLVEINAQDSEYLGSGVRVEISEGKNFGVVQPLSVLNMSPKATFTFDANFAAPEGGVVAFKVHYEKTNIDSFFKVGLIKDLPIFKSVVPAQPKFIAHQLSYINVFVESGNLSVPLAGIHGEVYSQGVRVNSFLTDKFGLGPISINLPAGNYRYVLYLLYEGVRVAQSEYSFVVHRE